MNELEEMKRAVAAIVAAGDEFVRQMEEHNVVMEREHREMMRMIRMADENWGKTNTTLREVIYKL